MLLLRHLLPVHVLSFGLMASFGSILAVASSVQSTSHSRVAWPDLERRVVCSLGLVEQDWSSALSQSVADSWREQFVSFTCSARCGKPQAASRQRRVQQSLSALMRMPAVDLQITHASFSRHRQHHRQHSAQADAKATAASVNLG